MYASDRPRNTIDSKPEASSGNNPAGILRQLINDIERPNVQGRGGRSGREFSLEANPRYRSSTTKVRRKQTGPPDQPLTGYSERLERICPRGHTPRQKSVARIFGIVGECRFGW